MEDFFKKKVRPTASLRSKFGLLHNHHIADAAGGGAIASAWCSQPRLVWIASAAAGSCSSISSSSSTAIITSRRRTAPRWMDEG